MFEYIWNLIASNNGAKTPNPRLTADLISETLLEELESRIREAETFRKEREAQLKREAGTPDYSWLVNDSKKQYKMPQMLKIELEGLCSQLGSDDTPLVINDFRRIITNDTPVEKIPECFKAVLKRQLIVKDLKKDTEKDRKRTYRKGMNTHSFDRRLEVPHLREKDIEAWGTNKEGQPTARVSSAPASSWRFIRHGRIQPVHMTNNDEDDLRCNKSDEKGNRRANSVPTITTIV